MKGSVNVRVENLAASLAARRVTGWQREATRGHVPRLSSKARAIKVALKDGSRDKPPKFTKATNNIYEQVGDNVRKVSHNAVAEGVDAAPASQTAGHPLEPLSPEEVAAAVAILRATRKVTPTTRFVSLSLKEPPKALVYAFAADPSLPFPREAFGVLFDNSTNSCFEVAVSLDDQKVTSWKPIPGVQPTLTVDECFECEAAVQASEEFQAKLKEHYGIDDPSLVMVDIWSAGNYGQEEENKRRLARPLCFLRDDPTDNGYAKPLEGIRPVVDLNKMEVLRVEEYGLYALPPEQGNYAAARMDPAQFRTGIMPIEVTQPDGPSFSVQGNAVTWQNWSFVVGFNAREGLTLHNLSYAAPDPEAPPIPVLYRASLSEMVVPYGDPAEQQARKNAFDAGEYGIGMCTNSLELGCDCLGYIKYFDGHVCTSRGEPVTVKNAVCMHEEDMGVLWKHTDRRLPTPEVRRSRRLVISSMATVENYEYGFFWYLYQDGNIEFDVKMTGILSLGMLEGQPEPPYGTMIADKLYAPNHQHFFNMRLDLDIAGTANSVYQIDVQGEEPSESNPFMNAFGVKKKLLATEKGARSNLNMATDRTWKIVNNEVRNKTGMPVGYKFFPGMNCLPFAAQDAWWRRRAGFCDYHVWVTPNRGLEEQYAAGDYPNQSRGGDGLPAWTAQDRKIVDTDVVLWYTFGHTHIPRLEDYPVMPVAHVGFMLKPNGFFDQNPSNDLPPPEPKSGQSCCHD